MLTILGYRRSSSGDVRRVIGSHFTRSLSTVLVPSTPTISQDGVRSLDSSLLKRCLSQSHQHSNQKSCWKCGSAIAQGCTLFCGSPSCGAIQGLNEKECNYFKLFDIEEGFSLDSEQLEVAFKNLQRQLHPDKFAMSSLEERERSTFNSSFVNQAFQLLKSPVERVSYLMQSNGLDALEEGKTFSEPALMREMFELAEAADELEVEGEEEQAKVLAMHSDVEADIVAVGTEIQACYQRKDFTELSRAAVRLRYLSNVMDTLEAKLQQT